MPAFYVDFASPECYLACERILSLMPVPVEWIPVQLSPEPLPDAERTRLADLADARHIQPIRWPPPFDADFVTLTATYAKSIGRAVAFVQAALRQAYAGGRDLSVQDHVLIAASACEMHPTAILKTVQTRGPRRTLDRAIATAAERGVQRTPAIWVPPPAGSPAAAAGRVLHGDAALEDAAALLAEHATD
ncbi:hypothetical protein DSM112329_00224 [Paraconexibacter sp. AEG42_29]|uniref:DSBA-like thioredoxin domain-containing protein n=1 Tax=Paraconexibacter sp. AEG42_29 TaxID=2997339 RepID=A0AAU7APH2_9ACTN